MGQDSEDGLLSGLKETSNVHLLFCHISTLPQMLERKSVALRLDVVGVASVFPGVLSSLKDTIEVTLVTR